MTHISNSRFFTLSDSLNLAGSDETEVERRLRLYQIFVKLYEQHHNLLDEILQLENIYNPTITGAKELFFHGVVSDSEPYVTTNLSEAVTHCLRQAQNLWTIGSDVNCGITILNQKLSGFHAVIQYINHQGFYLKDLNSTHGSFVNGEPVYQSIKLKDGDKVRLGSVCFSFFYNQVYQLLPEVPEEILLLINNK
jgi:FHA domain